MKPEKYRTRDRKESHVATAADMYEDERNRRIHAETSWDAERALNRSALETIVSLSDWNTELQSEVKSLRQALIHRDLERATKVKSLRRAVKELQDLAAARATVTEFSRTESNQSNQG